MATKELPIRNDIFAYSMDLDLDGIGYVVRFRLNTRMDRWFMDISDASGVLLKSGIILLPDFPLTYKYVDRIPGFPPGQFFIIDETELKRTPDRENFGDTLKLVYQEANAATV